MKDYEGALEWHKNSVGPIDFLVGADKRDYETIIHALRFAEKMMREPSGEMLNAAYMADDIDRNCTENRSEIFKAMRDQALKEIDDGQ